MAQSRITEIEGDLFDAPDGAALIHACNCEGSWGGGIAKAFKAKYPAAYEIYKNHCKHYKSNPEYKEVATPQVGGSSSRTIKLPEGTALLIPPQEKDVRKRSKRHWVICLFTSKRTGKNVSDPDTILENTRLALADMKRQIDELGIELWSCRFNSGLFKVEWQLSRKVLEDFDLQVTVVRPKEESE
ncbi:hypothetical protein BDV59DRAFT_207486 [Aspergillus ambiguus]|uniref:macro domain-containing protein n=1 Tax=Aspergillus ambiguus TaxID=176160 RepID=UPI003CCD83E7